MELKQYTLPGLVEAGNISVSDKVFGVEYNEGLVWQVVKSFLAGARSAEAADPFVNVSNYGIPSGSDRFFRGSDNAIYRVRNDNGNIIIYKDLSGPLGNIGDREITSSNNQGSGNLWLWTDLKNVSEKGGLTGGGVSR